MFSWIAANIGTILICLVLLLVVTAIIVCLVRDKKKGKPDRKSTRVNSSH